MAYHTDYIAILLQFEGVIGDKPGQVPPGSTVHTAKHYICRPLAPVALKVA